MCTEELKLWIGEQFFLGNPAAHEEIWLSHINYLLVSRIEFLD